MAKKLKVGDTIRGYRVTKSFGPGAMAISYAAQAEGGPKIFLKQYKSPAPTVIWYAPFVDYQQELAARVRGGKAAHYAVRLVDAFEEKWGGPCYFQAYEFVEHGGDLQQILDEERDEHTRTGVAPATRPEVWARHVTWAKVLMAGIAALHESKIVHADLKPPNAYLIKDTSIGAGYQLKLIDMDFSVLADKRAPWHGYQGYVGTDNYRSPEHLTRGAVPGMPSDVFTCGLMLHELLAGTHPYWQDDQAEYGRLALAHAAKPPLLMGVMPGPATNAEVSDALHRCLSPDAAARPTAAELRSVLSGRGPRRDAPAAAAPAASPKARPAPAPAPAATAAPRAAGAPITSARMQLVGGAGAALPLGIRTELGKHLARQFGSDAEFWDARQCVLERGASGAWQVSPVAGTANETLLNGEVLTAPRPLHDGDVLAVGRKAKGIVKLPLTARAL
jgi:serine/threonine protein kinase